MSRLATLVIALGVFGCSKEINQFDIRDPIGQAVSARLELCGESTALVRSGDRFRMTKVANCEGQGKITVVLGDGRAVSCPIGYVTPGAAQRFVFAIVGSRCVSE